MFDKESQVFILGSQRSGTTELFNILNKVLGYSGDIESHLWPSVAAAWGELDAAVERMGGAKSPAYRHFTLGSIGPKTVKHELALVLSKMYLERFGPRWVDKTPGAKMVDTVPVLSEVFPEAKFIFMRRRGIENVMSQLRRFPERPFRAACLEWADCMQTWLRWRDKVHGRFIEVDQLKMAASPREVAHDLCALLKHEMTAASTIASYLEETRSEQTSISPTDNTLSLEDTRWTNEQRQIFIETCSAMMAAYGYSPESGRISNEIGPRPIPLMFEQSPNVQVKSSTGRTHFSWEALTLICGQGKPPEAVSIKDVTLAGHNTLKGVLRCSGPPHTNRASLTIRLIPRDGQEEIMVIAVDSGDSEAINWHFDPVIGPASVEFSATVADSLDAVTRVTLLRPRFMSQQ